MNVKRLAKEMNRQLEDSRRTDALTAPILESLKGREALSASELWFALGSDWQAVESELLHLESKGLVAKSFMHDKDRRYCITREGRQWLDYRNDQLRQEEKAENALKKANLNAWIALGISAGALVVAILAIIFK